MPRNIRWQQREAEALTVMQLQVGDVSCDGSVFVGRPSDALDCSERMSAVFPPCSSKNHFVASGPIKEMYKEPLNDLIGQTRSGIAVWLLMGLACVVSDKLPEGIDRSCRGICTIHRRNPKAATALTLVLHPTALAITGLGSVSSPTLLAGG